MKFLLVVRVVLLLLSATMLAAAQPRCAVRVELFNHNRYAYQTAEECSGFFHSVPWGNWGVNSNLGTRTDTDQFKGWHQPCSQTKVEWNSCSVNNSFRGFGYLNFPDFAGAYPYPANFYPFSDQYAWNDRIPPFGFSYHVDQYSPCGPNAYGSVTLTFAVTPRVDRNGDGIFDAGGCADLHGKPLTLQNNFMTLYELDTPDPDDLIQTLYFADLNVSLRCTPDGCFAVKDRDGNGVLDDVNDYFGPEYSWPTRYENQHGNVCNWRDRNVPCKRIDAAITVGRISGFFLQ